MISRSLIQHETKLGLWSSIIIPKFTFAYLQSDRHAAAHTCTAQSGKFRAFTDEKYTGRSCEWQREAHGGGGKKKQEGKATEVFKFYAAWLSYASLTKKQTKVGRIQVWQNSLYHNIQTGSSFRLNYAVIALFQYITFNLLVYIIKVKIKWI